MKLKRFKFNFIGRVKGRIGLAKSYELFFDVEYLEDAFIQLYENFENVDHLCIIEIKNGQKV
jgi:hypothetical protein